MVGNHGSLTAVGHTGSVGTTPAVRRTLAILTLNEIEGVRATFDRLQLDRADQVFVVDGGSTDGTVEFFRERQVKVVGQNRPGRGEAFRVAFQEAAGEYVVLFSPDGNEDPADIPRLFQLLEEGCDMAVASRFLKGSRNEEDDRRWRWRAWVNRAFTAIANLVWAGHVSDSINGFRGFRKSAWDELKLDGPGFVIEYQASIRCLKLGKNVGEIPTIEGQRIGGESTSKSLPTGLMFVKHLMREIRIGSGFEQPDPGPAVPNATCRYVLLSLLAAAFVFPFWAIHRFPSDLDGEVVQRNNAVLLMREGRGLHQPTIQHLEEVMGAWKQQGSSAITIELLPYSSPLSSMLSYVAYRLGGVSTLTDNALQALLQALTIGAVLVLGWTLFGWVGGVLAAVALGTSVFFNIISKFGQSPPGLVSALLFTTTLALLCLARRNRSRFLLVLSGIALGLVISNGWQGLLLCPTIVAVALLLPPRGLPDECRWNGSWRPNETTKTTIATVFAVAAVTLVAFVTWYSWYFNVPIRYTMNGMISNSFSRGSSLSGEWRAKVTLIPFLLRCLVVGVPPYTFGRLTHADQALPGNPIIAPVVTIFLLVGLFEALRRRSWAQLLLVTWTAAVVSAAATLWFQPRYTTVALPAFALLAGSGAATFLQWAPSWLRSRLDPARAMQASWAVTLLAFAVTAVTAGQAYFGEFRRADGFLMKAYGFAEVGRAIRDGSKADEALLVLSDRSSAQHELLYYHTGAQHRPFVYWWEDVVMKTIGTGPNADALLDAWEKQQLKTYRVIYYVFDQGRYYYEQPGWNFYPNVDSNAFRRLHPLVPPLREIMFHSGVPALNLYAVDRTTPRSSLLKLSGTQSSRSLFTSAAGAIDYVQLDGPAKGLTMTTTAGKASLPLDLPPSSRLSLTYDSRSELVERLPLDSANDISRAYRADNVTFSAEGHPAAVFSAFQGRLIYKVSAPAPIREIEFVIQLNFFHDRDKRNRMTMVYSVDGKTFLPVAETLSDGSGRWTRKYDEPYFPFAKHEYWVQRYTRFPVPGAPQVVYVGVEYAGVPGQGELWSSVSSGNPMIVRALLDGSALLKAPLNGGLNQMFVRAEGEPSSLLLASRTPISSGAVYEAETSPGFTGVVAPDSEASGGSARFANAARDKQTLVLYGPGEALPEGRYVAKFRVKVGAGNRPVPGNRSDDVAVVEVHADASTGRPEMNRPRALSLSDFARPGVYQDFAISFSTDGSDKLQYRVLWYPRADLWIDKVEVWPYATVPADELSTSLRTRFEAETLPKFTGRDAPDPAASHGTARYADIRADNQSLLTYGPGASTDRGSYVARFHLKVDSNASPDSVAVLDVTASRGTTTAWVKELPISGTDFKKSGVYQDFDVPYDADGTEQLQFRVLWVKKVSLWADYVDVQPASR